MPTKGTSTVVARVADEVILEIERRAKRRKLSKNAWLNWCITLGLRKHGGK